MQGGPLKTDREPRMEELRSQGENGWYCPVRPAYLGTLPLVLGTQQVLGRVLPH